MTITVDEKGTLSLYQGDSGEITISGLDETKNLTVYFAIQDKKRNLVGSELVVNSDNQKSVTFYLTPAFTDLLSVPKERPYEVFTYGIKIKNDDTGKEDTLFIENQGYGEPNLIVVYPRKVIGG